MRRGSQEGGAFRCSTRRSELTTRQFVSTLHGCCGPRVHLHTQDPETLLALSAIKLIVYYKGVSNTVVRDLMVQAARRGICRGNYSTSIWPRVTARVPANSPVLYTGEFLGEGGEYVEYGGAARREVAMPRRCCRSAPRPSDPPWRCYLPQSSLGRLTGWRSDYIFLARCSIPLSPLKIPYSLIQLSPNAGPSARSQMALLTTPTAQTGRAPGRRQMHPRPPCPRAP